MFEVPKKGPYVGRYDIEVRKEDLTLENIRAFFGRVALKILGDAERAPELVVNYDYGRGIYLEWLGQDMTWNVFLTRAAVALNLAGTIKKTGGYTKHYALERLFKIAEIERRKGPKEMFVPPKEEELTEKNVQAVLRDAAQKFLGDANFVARISPVTCPLVKGGRVLRNRVTFCDRTMEWGDFICSCSVRFHLSVGKVEAAKHYGEVLGKLFEIANITRPRSSLNRFLAAD